LETRHFGMDAEIQCPRMANSETQHMPLYPHGQKTKAWQVALNQLFAQPTGYRPSGLDWLTTSMWFGLRPALRASKFVPDEFICILAEMTAFSAWLDLCITMSYGTWEPAKQKHVLFVPCVFFVDNVFV